MSCGRVRSPLFRLALVWFMLAGLFLPAVVQALSSPRLVLPATNGEVFSIQIVGQLMYIGGNFTMIDTHSRAGVAAINLTDGSVDLWSPNLGVGAVVHHMVVSDDKKALYVAGEFEREFMGIIHKNVAKIDISSVLANRGNLSDDWHPDIVGAVRALALSHDERLIYLGGDFTQIDGVSRRYLAAMNLPDSQLTPWQPAPDAPVNKLLLSGDGSELYVAGGFSVIGSASARDFRRALAIVKASNGGVRTSWDAAIQGGAAEVFDIMLSEDNATMYVAGDFTDVGGQLRNNIAAIELSDATALSGFDPDVNGAVRALALNNERLYLVGEFSTLYADAIPRSHLAALDISDYSVLDWAPALPATAVINALSTDMVNDELVIAGNFQYIVGADDHQDVAVFDIALPVTTAISIPPNTIALPSAFAVKLECLDNTDASCAKIYYTIDGSEPTFNSVGPTGTTLDYNVSNPISISAINASTILKFLAIDADGNREFVQTKQYYVDDLKPQTTVTLEPGDINVASNVPVELRCTDGVVGSGCVETRYSTDGNPPSIVYTEPFALADQDTLESLNKLTLQYQSIDLAGNLEDIKTADYTIDVVPPKVIVSDGGGNYVGSLTVILTCDDGTLGSGCRQLYYTLNGEPALTATPITYTGPIALTFTEGTMLRVYADDNAGNITEGLLGVYTFTSSERKHTRGVGGLTIGWLLLLLPLAWRRLPREY